MTQKDLKFPLFYLANEEIQQKTEQENSEYIRCLEFSHSRFPCSQDKRAVIFVVIYPIFVHTLVCTFMYCMQVSFENNFLESQIFLFSANNCMECGHALRGGYKSQSCLSHITSDLFGQGKYEYVHTMYVPNIFFEKYQRHHIKMGKKSQVHHKKVPEQIISIKKIPQLYLNLSRYKGRNYQNQ